MERFYFILFYFIFCSFVVVVVNSMLRNLHFILNTVKKAMKIL